MDLRWGGQGLTRKRLCQVGKWREGDTLSWDGASPRWSFSRRSRGEFPSHYKVHSPRDQRGGTWRVSFLGLPDKGPQTRGLNTRNVSAHSPGGWKPEFQVPAGWLPPEAARSVQVPLLGLEVAVFSLCPFSSLSLYACLCPRLRFLQGHRSCWIRDHPNDLILS